MQIFPKPTSLIQSHKCHSLFHLRITTCLMELISFTLSLLQNTLINIPVLIFYSKPLRNTNVFSNSFLGTSTPISHVLEFKKNIPHNTFCRIFSLCSKDFHTLSAVSTPYSHPSGIVYTLRIKTKRKILFSISHGGSALILTP